MRSRYTSKTRAAEAITEIDMKIGVLGLGYVGLANVGVLASIGHQVVGYDINKDKVLSLSQGSYPFDDRALEKAVREHKDRISYVSDVVSLKGMDAYILALPTPEKEDGSCDTSYMDAATESLISVLNPSDTVFLIIRSTVSVGYASNLRNKLKNPKIHVISLPEFVREGTTYNDEKHPDRFVVGVDDDMDFEFVKRLRKDALEEGTPFLKMNNQSAELTKYAANSFLAMKISYINSLAYLSKKVGADIEDVASGMGSDHRIGKSMLGAGVGYGGSCFPKDTKAIRHIGRENGVSLPLIEDTIKINEEQPIKFLNDVKENLGDLGGKTIAVLGLAYKDGIADVRSSVSMTIIERLLEEGAVVNCFDSNPLAMKAMKERYEGIVSCDSIESALNGADAVMILTRDKSFLSLKGNKALETMKNHYIFDGRNLFKKEDFPSFVYFSIGR